MKQDGTKYLALVEFTNGEQEWMVVNWGVAARRSDMHRDPEWVSHELRLRNPKFLKYIELDTVTYMIKGQNEWVW